MMKKKRYIKPIVDRVNIDYTITLQMGSPPTNPTPRSGSSGSNTNDTPFQSPFGDKPFS
jgi:hypothetical protein